MSKDLDFYCDINDEKCQKYEDGKCTLLDPNDCPHCEVDITYVEEEDYFDF